MADLIPEGCISLREAYDRFAPVPWRGHLAVAELTAEISDSPALVERSQPSLAAVTNLQLEEFRKVFANGSLNALVRPPGAPHDFAIPRDSWDTAFFPERAFLDDQLSRPHGGYWDSLVDRTPFVQTSGFEPWLSEFVERQNDPKSVASPAKQALRRHLLDLAAEGSLQPSRVEELGIKWGLEEFARKPPAADFDPTANSHWTLCMAAVWIAYRDLDAVRDVMDTCRQKTWVWSEAQHGDVRGMSLASLPPTSLSELELLEATGDSPLDYPAEMRLADAEHALWNRLGEGRIESVAVDPSGSAMPIAATQWPSLKLATDTSGADYLCSKHKVLAKAFEKVAVRTLDLLELWPPRVAPVQSPAPEAGTNLPRPRNGKLLATIEAIKACYPHGVPSGLTSKERMTRINEWLTDNGNSEVGSSTILRALERI